MEDVQDMIEIFMATHRFNSEEKAIIGLTEEEDMAELPA